MGEEESYRIIKDSMRIATSQIDKTIMIILGLRDDIFSTFDNQQI